MDEDIASLAAFLNLRLPPSYEVPHLNAKPRSKPKRWHEWTDAEKQIFLRHCGQTMDQHYPGWREDDWQNWGQPFGQAPFAAIQRAWHRMYERIRG